MGVVDTGHDVVESQKVSRGGCVVLGSVVVSRRWDGMRVVVEEIRTKAVVQLIKIAESCKL
jgi:hypothetical protein